MTLDDLLKSFSQGSRGLTPTTGPGMMNGGPKAGPGGLTPSAGNPWMIGGPQNGNGLTLGGGPGMMTQGLLQGNESGNPWTIGGPQSGNGLTFSGEGPAMMTQGLLNPSMMIGGPQTSPGLTPTSGTPWMIGGPQIGDPQATAYSGSGKSLQDVFALFQKRPTDINSYLSGQGFVNQGEGDDWRQPTDEGGLGRANFGDLSAQFGQTQDPLHYIRQAADGRYMTYEPGMTLDSPAADEYQKLMGLKTVRDALKKYDPGFNEANWLAPNTEQNPFDTPAYLRSEQYDYSMDSPDTEPNTFTDWLGAMGIGFGLSGGLAGISSMLGGGTFGAGFGGFTGGLTDSLGLTGEGGLFGGGDALGLGPDGGGTMGGSAGNPMFGDIYNAFNAADPIEAMHFIEQFGGPQAFGATDMAGALKSINPEWLSALPGLGEAGAKAAQGVASGTAGTAGPESAAAKSALAKFFSGEGSLSDYLKIAGIAASTGLGVLGAKGQQDALSGVSDKYLALGAPHRARLESTYAPGFDLNNEPGFKSAMDTAAQTQARLWSPRVGNPADQPAAQAEIQKYLFGNVALPQLNTMRSQLGTFGQLGVNTAGTAAMGGAQTSGGMYDALGYGLSNLLAPKEDDLASLLRKFNLSSGTTI